MKSIESISHQLSLMQSRLGNDALDCIMNSFVQEAMPNGGVRVYNTNPEYANSEILIRGNEVFATAGGRIDDQHLNEFLNNVELMPSMVYHIDGCMDFHTDALGRVIRTEADVSKTIRLDRSEQRGELKSIADMKDGRSKDVGGHGVANVYGGPTEAINISAMDGELNNGDYKAMEKYIYRMADSWTRKVRMTIHSHYPGSSKRPSSYDVEVCIDGKTENWYFDN